MFLHSSFSENAAAANRHAATHKDTKGKGREGIKLFMQLTLCIPRILVGAAVHSQECVAVSTRVRVCVHGVCMNKIIKYKKSPFRHTHTHYTWL
jgi:hypothetical protein